MSITGKSAAEMMAGISVKPMAAELREAKKREAEAERAQLVAGSIWRKNDRANGLVKVMQRMHLGDSFAIRPVNADGEFIGKLMLVHRDRFGGTKRGNYAFVRAE